MRSALATFSATLLVALAATAIAEPKAQVENTVGDLPPYSGPKAALAVAKFEWKAGGEAGGVQFVDPEGRAYTWTVTQQGYMTGLADMLTTALVQSNRFRVLERAEFGQVQAEVELSEQGWVEEGSQQERGKVKGADLLVVAAITGWDPGSSGVGVGLGGFGGLAGALGGVKVKKSKIAMDIRLVDAETAEVVQAASIKGEAKDVSFGGLGGGIGGGMALLGGLEVYQNTPMEKAVRVCIAEAVKFVATNTPQEYFTAPTPPQ